MAIKKSELYSSIWASCDELRGGMDASQYKDYVLFMLFFKYISDKYANSDDFAPPVSIPPGSSFQDMLALRGQSDIGEKINTQIIRPLIENNSRLSSEDFPDFNDKVKLGEGKEMVDRITNLINIFNNPKLDFSKNKAENDDILGDAYEYLMRHFAQESGKSKGQFYTPSEVSRIMAKVLGVNPKNTVAGTSVYDPTCGSGSLLLKVAAEAGKRITLEGQEKEAVTAGLARMNMMLHDFPTAKIMTGNTLANPKFLDGFQLRTYDYIVANPPFSDKNWSSGITPTDDTFRRFDWGEPPAKQGDYAYLLHIVKSMKSTGKACCILPHGVLFRGNAEAIIREKLVQSGILKGVIGLPANLFYGTGIPACILVLDKETASSRKGVFFIDASKGFVKDGNKNRLREQDIHKIVDAFSKEIEIEKYSRFVSLNEIADAKNDFNLNIPRYIDSTEAEDLQDIDAHLNGGIPKRDIDSLSMYWSAYPNLQMSLFKELRPGYYESIHPKDQIKKEIMGHPDYQVYSNTISSLYTKWATTTAEKLKELSTGFNPKELIAEISESLLVAYSDNALIDKYDVYQILMNYWNETMQDDMYLISEDGWVAVPKRILEINKKTGKSKDKGWSCDLLPPDIIIDHYFDTDRNHLNNLQSELETVVSQIAEMEEENSGDEGCFAEFDKVNKGSVAKRVKELGKSNDAADELEVLNKYLELSEQQAKLNGDIKKASEALDKKAWEQYAKLTTDDVKQLVVDAKWMSAMQTAIDGEMERISQRLTGRIKELIERYETTLPKIDKELTELESKVNAHLQKMGFVW